MITDAMLRKAAAEADEAIRNSLPDKETCNHPFSLGFEEKMKRVIRRERRVPVYTFLRWAACLIAAVLLGSSVWLTIDTEARAAFFSWVKECYDTYVVYQFVGEPDNQKDTMTYQPGWLPEGYEKTNESFSETGSFLVYQNEQGEMISFICSRGTDSTALFLITDDTTPLKVSVGDLSADFYPAANGEISNGLVWVSETGDMVFCITAPLSEQTLIQIAESIEEK